MNIDTNLHPAAPKRHLLALTATLSVLTGTTFAITYLAVRVAGLWMGM